MDAIEQRAAIKRLKALYHSYGYEMNDTEIKRTICSVMNQCYCEAEEAYQYVEDKIKQELKPL